MRPDFSVSVSPSATKMKGVDTRMAPPSMAVRTMASWAVMRAPCRPEHAEDGEAAVERLGGEQHHEDEALQHQHGGVRHAHAALHEAARRREPAEQDRHDRTMAIGIVPGQERHQDAGEAVAGRQRGIGPALDGRDLEIAREARAGAGERAAGEDQPADRQALRLGGPHVAAGDAGREAEGGARHQDAEQDGDHDRRPRSPSAR